MKTKIAIKKILLLAIILAIGTFSIIYASPNINNKHNNNTIVNNSNLNTADLKKIKQEYDSVCNQAKELKSNIDIQHNKDNKLIINENNIAKELIEESTAMEEDIKSIESGTKINANLEYIPHYCHEGPQHEYCELVSDGPEECGYEYQEVRCCCGLVMVQRSIFCEEHQ